jgi:hypothetical protein
MAINKAKNSTEDKVSFIKSKYLKHKTMPLATALPKTYTKKDSLSTKHKGDGIVNFAQQYVCENCGWSWNTADSDESDKYVCHKCGFDNSPYYEHDDKTKYNNMQETIIALPDTYSSEERLKDILKEQGYDIVKSYEHGGEVQPDDKKTKNMITHKSGSAGGMLVGNRHSEGGIKAINKSTDTPLEMEGGEVVITRNAVSDSKKREFDGEMLTNRQILSRINESGGGVSFADGGDIPHKCSCSGKSYAYGGRTMTDYEIVDDIHTDYDTRMFGVQHTDKSNSESFELLFIPTEHHEKSVNLYGQGGMIRLVHKKVPSFKAFSHAHSDISLVAMKKSYKQTLQNEYNVDFDKLPQKIKVALLIGNQKLVDNYLNS